MLDLEMNREGPPPRDAATLVVVRDAAAAGARADGGGVEVFCVQRQRGGFLGGAIVFPGGKLEPDDADPAWAEQATAAREEKYVLPTTVLDQCVRSFAGRIGARHLDLFGLSTSELPNQDALAAEWREIYDPHERAVKAITSAPDSTSGAKEENPNVQQPICNLPTALALEASLQRLKERSTVSLASYLADASERLAEAENKLGITSAAKNLGELHTRLYPPASEPSSILQVAILTGARQPRRIHSVNKTATEVIDAG